LKPYQFLPKVPLPFNEGVVGFKEDPTEHGSYYPETRTVQYIKYLLEDYKFLN
jgi:hypothetical protein